MDKAHPTPRKSVERPYKDAVDETADQSFPASDPPAFTGSHAGYPRRHNQGSAPGNPDKRPTDRVTPQKH